MNSPRVRNEVTKEWVEYMLTEHENRNNPGSKVTLHSWNIGDATKKGDDYCGALTKLEAKATVQCTGNGQQEKDYNHIIKFQSRDPFLQETTKILQNGGNEVMIYSTIIEEFNYFHESSSDNQFPVNIPKHIYSKHNDEEYILVMENMKKLDYDTNSRNNGLGIEEAKLALEQLARLHGISYAYHKKYYLTKKYPTFNSELFKQIVVCGHDCLIDMVIDFLKAQNEHQNVLKKVKSAKPHILKKINEAFKERNTQIYCLNHGDLWIDNILLKQNSDTNEEKVALINWKGAHWNTSSFDLAYFMAGALIPEMRKYHSDILLQHYHSHFTSVTTKLGCPIPEWGFEQLKAEYEAVQPWVFAKALKCAMFLSEASKEWNITNHNTPNQISQMIMNGLAKRLIPLVFKKPSRINDMLEGQTKKLINPVSKELKSKSNYDLNERVLSCILEADENGVFDDPSDSPGTSGCFGR